MTQREISLFNYAIAVINNLKNQGQPMPLRTDTVCQYLEIDRRRLTKQNPYLFDTSEKHYKVCFSHSEQNVDYWFVYEKFQL